MININIGAKLNKNLTPEQLRTSFEEVYYRVCIERRDEKTSEQIDKALKDLIHDLNIFENLYLKEEMYEHCAVCRDVNKELAENLDLTISI